MTDHRLDNALARLLPAWAAQGQVVRQRQDGPGGKRAVLRVIASPFGDCHLKVYAQAGLAPREAGFTRAAQATADAIVAPCRLLAEGDHWLATATVDAVAWDGQGDDLTKSVGRWLRRFHQLPPGLAEAAAQPTLPERAALEIARLRNGNILGGALVDQVLAALAAAEARLAGRKGTPSLVHGDFSYRQCMVAAGLRRVVVIDFLTARQGWPEDDLAFWIAKQRIGRLLRPGAADAASDDALVAGYGDGLDKLRLGALILLHSLRIDLPLKWRGQPLRRLATVPFVRVRWRGLVCNSLVEFRALL